MVTQKALNLGLLPAAAVDMGRGEVLMAASPDRGVQMRSLESVLMASETLLGLPLALRQELLVRRVLKQLIVCLLAFGPSPEPTVCRVVS